MVRLPLSVVVATGAIAVGGAAVLAAFLVSTVTVNVDIAENIVVDSPTTIELTMFPSESQQVEVVLRNIGAEDQPASIEGELITEGNGLSIISPGSVVVPADGFQHTYVVTITAASDVEPGMHILAIEVERE